MKHGLDEYAHLDSPIHRWEPRCKFVGLMALIFAFSFVEDWRLLLPMLSVTLTLYRLSRLPRSFLLSQLRYPGYFLLGIVVFLPWISGETVLLRLGFLTLRQEGLLATLLVSVRFFSIVTTSLILFGTSAIVTMLKAMRSLGLPQTLADMMLLFYRYLYEMGDLLNRMQTAMQLRGFQMRRLSRRNLTQLAALTGTLLVRSYEQAEQVYQAMRLRGYGYSKSVQVVTPVRFKDTIALVLVIFVAIAFVVAEFL